MPFNRNLILSTTLVLVVACSGGDSNKELSAAVENQHESVQPEPVPADSKSTSGSDNAERNSSKSRVNNASESGLLPLGESGENETLDAFMTLCVRHYSNDLPKTFEVVKASNYDIKKEASRQAVMFGTGETKELFEGRARSFSLNPTDKPLCMISVKLEHASSAARCRVSVRNNCAEKLTNVEAFGPRFQKVLDDNPAIVFNEFKTGRAAERIKRDTVRVYDLLDKDSETNQIILQYDLDVGSTEIWSRHEYKRTDTSN